MELGRREYEDKREEERLKTAAEVQKSEKEFNAGLLAKLLEKVTSSSSLIPEHSSLFIMMLFSGAIAYYASL